MLRLLLVLLPAMPLRAADEVPADEARADEAVTFADVRRPLGSGAAMNWTRLRVERTASSDKSVGAWRDPRDQEQDAFGRLGPALSEAAREVCVTPEHEAGDFLDGDGMLAERLRDGLDRWSITETRYHSSGWIELDGVLDARQWLRPVLVSLASTRPMPPLPEAPTGVVVEARGLDFDPCLAPEIRLADGGFLTRAQAVAEETVRLASPVLYVADPADPRAAGRAGAAPVFVRAASGGRGRLSLEPAGAAALERSRRALAARGRVVVVIDAEAR